MSRRKETDVNAAALAVLTVAIDKADTARLHQWAQHDAHSLDDWKRLSQAWSMSSNQGFLSWPLLQQCIELAHEANMPLGALPLLSLHTFVYANPPASMRWMAALDRETTQALMEQVVAWRLAANPGDAHAMQSLQTQTLLKFAVDCLHGHIWKDHPVLYAHPMSTRQALQYTESSCCVDRDVYDAIWHYQKEQTSRQQWKRQCLENIQYHNFCQLSATPFVATEYVLEQHALKQESYTQIFERSLFPHLELLDQWMCSQLCEVSGTWEEAACPSPEDGAVQAWWYALQLGADDATLLAMRSQRAPETMLPLDIPEDAFKLG